MQSSVFIRLFLLTLIIKNCILVRGQSQFRFTAQPHNVHVTEGDEANFPCTFEGSFMIPIWVINGFNFVWNSLPEQHNFDGEELIVQNVALSLNGSTYQCLLPGFGRSSIGILFVSLRSATFTTHVPSLPTSILTIEPTSIQASSTLNNPMVVSLVPTTTVANSIIIANNSVEDKFNIQNQWFIVLAGAIFITGILFLIAISVILCYRYHKKKDSLTRSRSSVILKRNDAYECRTNFRVKMKSNPAYEPHDISAN